MVDAVDSKSAVSNGVGVQVPPGVQEGKQSDDCFFFVPERDLEARVVLVKSVFSGGLSA